MTSRERAARLAEALGRANEVWSANVSSGEIRRAFEDRRVLAAELGRVLLALTPEQQQQVFREEESVD